MKKIILLSFILTALICSTFAQQILLEEKPENLYKVSKMGENRTHFTHFYFSFGSYVDQPETDALKIVPGLSNQTSLGLRYKLKFCNFYAWGLDMNWSFNRQYIKQNSANFFPDSLSHKKEIFSYNTLGLEYYNRFNFGKRGNMIGKYLDLGVWGNWMFSPKHTFWDTYDDPLLGAQKSKIILSSLNYTTDLHWGIGARIGFNRWVVFGKYRMSELLNSKYQSQNIEPSKLVVGVEVGFF